MLRRVVRDLDLLRDSVATRDGGIARVERRRVDSYSWLVTS